MPPIRYWEGKYSDLIKRKEHDLSGLMLLINYQFDNLATLDEFAIVCFARKYFSQQTLTRTNKKKDFFLWFGTWGQPQGSNFPSP